MRSIDADPAEQTAMSLRNPRLAPAALTSVLSLALVLGGCQKAPDGAASADSAMAAPALPATLPMTNAPAQQVTLAPAATALPRAQPLRTVRVADPRSAYAYADQASYVSQSLGEAPPDYSFSYDNVSPWAWQGYDGSRTFVEPVAGGYRTYYYRAGAEQPYFVRDPDYGYGYDGDQLAAIYGPDGALIPYDSYGPREAYAAAYLWRARRMYEASRERQAISAADWAARQNSIIAAREQWAANRDRQADWAAYHAQEAAQESRYWAQEAQRRAEDQQRFDQWHEQDFRTPPPPRAIPPHWQQANWAQDSARYAPVVAAAVAGGAAAALLARHHQNAAPQHPPMPPQPVAQPARPAPAPPAVRPERQMQPGPMPHAPWQGHVNRPPAPHEQTPAIHHSPVPPQPPRAMAPQRPNSPRPEARVPGAEVHQARHAFPPMRPPEPSVTVHRGNQGIPQEHPVAPRVPIHGGAPSAPMTHPARPPETRPAPAMMPSPAPAPQPQHHEGGGQQGGAHPEGRHAGGGEHHGHP
ncbi:hypothetical protein [Novosphingobium rosa]|uniref:hypothetical protein n=1 Tax=Novosphingobium rosa TaxID=76978 RepID=UPI00082B8EB1|nr:hypothetical protein [Novosphingobium rosa]